MDRGIDRNRQDRAQRLAGITLEQAFADYMNAKPLAPRTRHDYEYWPLARSALKYDRASERLKQPTACL